MSSKNDKNISEAFLKKLLAKQLKDFKQSVRLEFKRQIYSIKNDPRWEACCEKFRSFSKSKEKLDNS